VTRDKKLKGFFIKDELVSASEYLKIINSSLGDEIERAYFVAPKSIASKKFGRFRIEYKNPVARAY
jgi:hypothetical protein